MDILRYNPKGALLFLSLILFMVLSIVIAVFDPGLLESVGPNIYFIPSFLILFGSSMGLYIIWAKNNSQSPTFKEEILDLSPNYTSQSLLKFVIEQGKTERYYSISRLFARLLLIFSILFLALMANEFLPNLYIQYYTLGVVTFSIFDIAVTFLQLKEIRIVQDTARKDVDLERTELINRNTVSLQEKLNHLSLLTNTKLIDEEAITAKIKDPNLDRDLQQRLKGLRAFLYPSPDVTSYTNISESNSPLME